MKHTVYQNWEEEIDQGRQWTQFIMPFQFPDSVFLMPQICAYFIPSNKGLKGFNIQKK